MKNQNKMEGIIASWSNVLASEFEIEEEAFKK
jgi:hypothetical protein